MTIGRHDTITTSPDQKNMEKDDKIAKRSQNYNKITNRIARPTVTVEHQLHIFEMIRAKQEG
jgi:hypothetical protein